jgi:hypothetical protein
MSTSKTIDNPSPPLAGATGSAFVRVANVAPFWRYAVGPTSAFSPAIPCYTLKSALALFEEVQCELPWCGAILYKRVWFRGIETLREYRPNDQAHT